MDSTTGIWWVPALLLATTLPVTPAAAAPAPAPVTSAAAPRPVGWQTYRRLDLLPYLTTGAQTRQFSSFDRGGGNDHDGFDGLYTCRRVIVPDGCVLAEDSGAGEITSIWFTRFGGDVSTYGLLRIVLDGQIVLNANLQDVVNGTLGPPFSHPLVANAAQSSGGVYIKVPMPYRSAMRVTVQNNHGFYHLTYRHFADPTGIATFDPADRADDVLTTLRAAGTADPKPALPGSVALRTLSLAPGQTSTPTQVTGPGVITTLAVRVPQVAGQDAASDEALALTRLRISFDGRRTVDAPLGEFFGSGLGEYPVRSLLFAMDPAVNGWYRAWWPMPFATGAAVTLYNGGSRQLSTVDLSVSYAGDPQWTAALAPGGDAGYFTALSRRADTAAGDDWLFADVTGRGKFVGVSHTMNGLDPGGWSRTYLEGDERVYTDGALSPQWYGTGTEDFYEAGWYFVNGPFSAPMTGHSAHEVRADGCQYECDAAYRLTLADAVGYRTSLRFGIEHGGTNMAPASYGSTAFLYAQPSRSARVTDLVDVGDPQSRAAHGYAESGTASQADLTGVFEGDNDLATTIDQVRSTTAPVSFRLAIDPANRGVTLRRIGDQDRGYQTARVFVDGANAGTWLQPLGNPHQRWLEDAFPLPPGLTAGKAGITVRLEPQPGAPAWTAASYAALAAGPPVPERSGGRTDVDGDGRDDLVAFTQDADADVFVARSTGSAFGPRTRWHDAFAPAGRYPLTGDVDGDGRDDVVAFTRADQMADVQVALSTGTSFGPAARWHDNFAPAGSVPAIGDLNGDGRDDIVVFTQASPWAVVNVALSTGTSFGPVVRWHDYFSAAGETPAVGDVNGDGRDDAITFTHGSPWAVVYVALSTGASFGPGQQWHPYFSAAGQTPRVGDVDGDGLADLVNFTGGTEADVHVALSTGTGFGPAAYWHGYFAPTGELPYARDVDGNGRDDIVTFTRNAAADVYAAVSTGWAFGWGYLWHDTFGFPGETLL